MNLDNNTIIKCNLNYGFKFIKSLEVYNLVLIDDISILIKNKKDIKEILSDSSGLLLYIDKDINCSKINYLDMELICKKELNNKYLYFYGHKGIVDIYNDESVVDIIDKNVVKIDEDDKTENVEFLNIFNKDNVLSFNVNRILNKGYSNKTKINVLDLTIGEDLVQLLFVNNMYKVVILGRDKIKVRTTSSIYGKKISLIELMS